MSDPAGGVNTARRCDPPVGFSNPATDLPDSAPKSGIGLCVSGGGYRAMLFHLGAFWRLNDVGYLKKLNRVSSVSGGSITAGFLGLRWSALTFDGKGVATNFPMEIVAPIRKMGATTIDKGSIIGGIFGPGSISDKIRKAYDKTLFHDATLQALPDDQTGPRFVINATNVMSGALCRFSKPYIWDYRVGEVEAPKISLSAAVTASSAFPPVLSPCEIKFPDGAFKAGTGTDLQRPPFTNKLVLTDGGVYDNLGLETVWKNFTTVLVSDAGGKMSADETPKGDWARHSMRVLDLIDNQVRCLRKRQVIDSFIRGERKGTYWGVRTNIKDYGPLNPPPLPCPFERTQVLANYPTRLAEVDPTTQERLINWGYAVCDAAIRTHVNGGLAPPIGFPYPASGV
jgi:NTE family protein